LYLYHDKEQLYIQQNWQGKHADFRANLKGGSEMSNPIRGTRLVLNPEIDVP